MPQKRDRPPSGRIWLEGLRADVQHAVRLWAKSPGFTAVALLTLGLGIGASTALVGQVNAVFFTPLPVSDAQSLRLLAWTSPRPTFVMMPNVFRGPTVDNVETHGSFSYPAYVAMRDNARTFSSLACWLDFGDARPVVLGEQGFGLVQFVSGNFFDTVGVRASVGRSIQPQDDDPAVWAPVAMVSHAFWQRALGGSAEVTRQTLNLNGRAFSIIGVLPEHFAGLDPAVAPDVFVPMGATTIAAATANPLLNPRLWNQCRVVGRLTHGVSADQARTDLEQWVAESIAAQPPSDPYDAPRLFLVDGSRGLATLREAVSTPLFVILFVGAGLLLAACANIAGLLLVRGDARQRELATRLALGAPRGRIVRQLLTESLVLALAGGALGLVLAFALSGATGWLLSQFMPTLFGRDRTLAMAASLDPPVLAVAVGLTLVASLLFGALPAVLSSQIDLIGVIRQSSTAGRPRASRINAGQAMVFLEAAVAMLLVVAAALFLRTIMNLRNEPLGVDPDGVVYARVEPRSGALPGNQRRAFFESAVKRLQSLPGVSGVSAGANPPMGGAADAGVRTTAPVCTASSSEGVAQIAAFDSVLPGYFSVLGVAVKAGREFEWQDNAPPGSRVLVNESFAARYLGRGAPVGQPVTVGIGCARRSGGGASVFAMNDVELTVVGVVADMHGPRATPEPMMYLPLLGFIGPVTLIVRTGQEPAAMIPAIRRAVRELHAQIPTFGEATLVDLHGRQFRRERLLSNLFALFGVTTLLVCCIGIYGLIAYAVTRRRAEIGVRMAIGASASSIVGMVIRESLTAVFAGMVVGTVAAVALSRWFGSLLYGVSGADPLALVGASVVFLLAAMAAAALPARAATKVDPVTALRQ